MKLFRMLGRNIRDSFKSVFRNFSLSLASISCITITLIVVALSMVLSANVNNFADNVEKDLTIVVFIERGASDEIIEKLGDSIDLLNYVESKSFKDRMDITKEMIEEDRTFEMILSKYTRENTPVRDEYLIKVTDIEKIGEVADSIRKMENVYGVEYGETIIDSLITIFDVLRKASYISVIALILVTAFLISNTIKITIFSRKREIEIMRLVGASNLNIKIPFIFEGLFLGIIGTIIPIVLTTYGYVAIYQNFNGQVFSPFLRLISPTPFIYQTSLLLLVIGMLVGMFGSYRAVKKHLKI